MYKHQLHQYISNLLLEQNLDVIGKDNNFYNRFLTNINSIEALFNELYEQHPQSSELFDQVLTHIINAYLERSCILKQKDMLKLEKLNWFLSNEITGMSLYVDRFCGTLQGLQGKINYLKNLGVNLLHLMPLFQSPEGESDGGYAVSNFREVDTRFGSLNDLKELTETLQKEDMYLMLDIVLNHTSHQHEWATKAKSGNKEYQDFFYMYPDRNIPDEFEKNMPEIFPEAAPGNFTWNEDCGKWVMTVFHNYQWDLNYTNPKVFAAMLENIFFYANLGVDILRIDAPAFIWKEKGTSCQNLPKAHTILKLIKQCVQTATPGMALLGEAIVAPNEIMKYFGTDAYMARECDFAYNATHMALQWDMLATGDTRIMLAAQHELLKKPFGTTWITYTRCHDDIGLGYDDWMIEKAGFNPYEHRKFLKEYYSGILTSSPAKGALFSVNPKTQDARISGSLASLCGLEKAIEQNNDWGIKEAINKIILMQAHSFFIGGVPMIFYGDEVGYTNDYSYLQDDSRFYDNRWMHRPVIDWEKNKKIEIQDSIEQRIFEATRKLITLRKKLVQFSDYKNIVWISPHNIHVAGFIRTSIQKNLYCFFNFQNKTSFITWYAFKENGEKNSQLFDHWSEEKFIVGADNEYFTMAPYSFCIMEEC